MIVFVRKWVLKLAFWVCYPLPLRDKIVIASSHGASLGGNLRSIHDELVRRGMANRTVLLQRPASRLEALLWGIRAEYHLATARVFIVDDYFFPLYVARPKPGTRVIQTWHASGAFKKIGYSVLDKTFGANAALVRQVDIHSNYDFCLMGSTTSVPAYSEAFHQPAEKFVTSLGIPRTDVFFEETGMTRMVADVYSRYDLPSGKRILLYAPTFRGTNKRVARSPEDLDLGLLKDVLGRDWVVLVRLHPFAARNLALSPELQGFAFNASDYPDINALMMASDLLLTDYSSVIFEYSLLERPMAFFAPDVADYEAERSFYFDYASGVPGPVFKSTEPLADYISAGCFDIERVHAFKERSFEMADGHATERVVEQLILPALKVSNG